MSSRTGDQATMSDLDRRMAAFYGQASRRAKYQAMLDTVEDMPIEAGSVADHLLRSIVRCGAPTVLEVGCANGRMYRYLRNFAFKGDYAGLELADGVIRNCRDRHPEARWEVGSGYHIPVADGKVGACFAFYVLEHTVYPERMLAEMLRVTAPGGSVYLAFPDFTAAGFLSSQLTGLSPGTARQKLRHGRYWDAVVTL
jgi:SAM-dependent methyltransferase